MSVCMIPQTVSMRLIAPAEDTPEDVEAEVVRT